MKILIQLFFLLSQLAGAEPRSIPGLAPQVSVPVHLTFLPKVVTSSENLYLADIARCEGRSKICREISDILLGESPPPGEKSYLSLAQIQAIVLEEFSGIYLTMDGADKVLVSSEGVRINKSALERALRDTLKNLDGFDRKRLRLNRIRVVDHTLIRPGKQNWSFENLEELYGLAEKSFARRTQQIPMVAVNEGVGDRRINILAQFFVEQYIPVPTESIPARVTLEENLFSYQWVPYQHRHLGSLKFILGKSSRRRLAAGQGLRETDLFVPYAVHRGKSIEVLINQGSLKLKSRGKALQSARVGDRLTIALENSKKRVVATLVNRKLAEVNP